jgi:hypothetical protein
MNTWLHDLAFAVDTDSDPIVVVKVAIVDDGADDHNWLLPSTRNAHLEDDAMVSDLRASSSRLFRRPRNIMAHQYKPFQTTHSILPASQPCNGETLQTAFMTAPAEAHSAV